MSLPDRDAFTFYMKAETRHSDFKVIPMSVSGAAAELENIFTYSYYTSNGMAYFAIGKVKET